MDFIIYGRRCLIVKVADNSAVGFFVEEELSHGMYELLLYIFKV